MRVLQLPVHRLAGTCLGAIDLGNTRRGVATPAMPSTPVDRITDAWPVVACLAAWVAMAALGGSPGHARRLGACLGVASYTLAWWLPAHWPLPRALLALTALWTLARFVELTSPALRTGPPGRQLVRRLWHLLGIVDTRRARRVPRAAPWRRLAALIAWLAVAAGGLALVVAAGPSPSETSAGRDALAWAARWLGGAALCYASSQALSEALRAGHAIVGWEVQVLHVWPIGAASLAEFWGQRWNLPVSGWLREHWFLPWARRRRPGIALHGSFALSGAFHAAFVLPAAGGAVAMPMLGFFVLVGLGVAIERRFVRSWPRAAARAWTLAFLLAASPLFVEPGLRVALSGLGAG